MASNAYSAYLERLLQDAEELDQAHRKLRTGGVGRQWGIGALNRGAVVMCLSAWEAFVEELAKAAIEKFRPVNPGGTAWQSVNATVRAQIGRFNTPNADNVRTLFCDAIGIADVTQIGNGITTRRSKRGVGYRKLYDCGTRLRTALTLDPRSITITRPGYPAFSDVSVKRLMRLFGIIWW